MLLKSGLEALKKWRQEANKFLSSEEKEELDLTLALNGMEKAIQENVDAVYEENAYWSWAKLALRMQHSQSMTVEERTEMRKRFRDEIREDNQLVSNKELKTLVDVAFIGAALKWRKKVIQSKKDSLLSALLAERVKEDELLVRGPSQDVLLEEFSCSLSIKESEDILAVVRNANPNAPASKRIWSGL